MSTAVIDSPIAGDIGDPTDAATSQIVSFRLANEEYGVEIMHVQEIILIGHSTVMPKVPDYVRGLINLRGHVIPIIDLRVRFNLEATEPTEHSRIIVVNLESKTIGIVVDEVNEVLRIDAKQLTTAPTGVTGAKSEYIKGLINFQDKLLILLDIEQIVAQETSA